MKNHLLALMLVAVAALWGWTFVVVDEAIHAYGVIGFLAVRFTIAAAVMGVVAARRMSLATLKVGLAIGVVLAVAYLMQTLGLKYTTPSNCGLITGLFVIFAPLSARLLFGVKTSCKFWVAIAVSLVGIAMLTGAGQEPPSLGDLLTLGCAALFGLHIALLGRYAKEHDAFVLTFAQLTTAAVLFMLLWPASASLWPQAESLAWPSGRVWFALIITGVFASAVAFLVQTYVQKRLPAARTAMILIMEPVFAAVFGHLLAKTPDERLGAVEVVGAVIMVAAMVLAELSSSDSDGDLSDDR